MWTSVYFPTGSVLTKNVWSRLGGSTDIELTSDIAWGNAAECAPDLGACLNTLADQSS